MQIFKQIRGFVKQFDYTSKMQQRSLKRRIRSSFSRGQRADSERQVQLDIYNDRIFATGISPLEASSSSSNTQRKTQFKEKPGLDYIVFY